MKDKINLIFKPYIITLLGLLAGYTFLHWVLIIQLELFEVKEIATNFGIPIVLAGIAAWIALRPRLKILNLENKNANLRDLYSALLWIILSVPVVIAQEYLVTATGQLTEVDSLNKIRNTKATKYYKLKNYFIDKNAAGIHTAFEVSGKNNTNFDMYIYVALPIFDKMSSDAMERPAAWLGVKYQATISNSLEQFEKEIEYQKFTRKAQDNFDNIDVSVFEYLDRLRPSDKRDGFIEAIKTAVLDDQNPIVFEAIQEPFETRNGNKLAWMIGSAVIGSLFWLLLILTPAVDEHYLFRIKAGKTDKEAEAELHEFIDFLKLKEGYFITPLLVYSNMGIYVVMAIAGNEFITFEAKDLLVWGANYGPSTKDGEWWRLLSSTFLHGGIMHLFANMYGLLFVGIFLEPILGRAKYLTVYLATGVLASIASIWWYDATVSVGASGAIFGVYGVFLTLLLTKVYPPDFSKLFLLSTAIFIGFNLLMGLTGGIDNAAHIGGLISGLLFGLIIHPTIKKQKSDFQEDQINQS